MLLALCAFLSASANAAFVQTDWKVENDSLAILDDDTGIEWLKLTETKGKSIAQIQSLLETTYAGWRLPTALDVNLMMSNMTNGSLNIDLSQQNYTGATSAHEAKAKAFITNFGETAPRYTSNGYSWANNSGLYIDDVSGYKSMRAYAAYAYNSKVYGSMLNDQLIASNLNGSSSSYGVFLVSDGGTTLSSINNPSLNINNANAPINNATVPVSGTLSLLGLGLLGFARRKNNT